MRALRPVPLGLLEIVPSWHVHSINRLWGLCHVRDLAARRQVPLCASGRVGPRPSAVLSPSVASNSADTKNQGPLSAASSAAASALRSGAFAPAPPVRSAPSFGRFAAPRSRSVVDSADALLRSEEDTGAQVGVQSYLRFVY